MHNKNGFTLIEIMISIGIIAILSTVLAVAVSTYLNNAKAASTRVDSQQNRCI